MAQHPSQIGQAPVPYPPAPQPGQIPGQPGEMQYSADGGYLEASDEAVEIVEEQKIPLDEVHIDELCAKVVELGASDLHLAVGLPPCVRLHGKVTKLHEYESFTPSQIQGIIYDILSDEQIQRFENELELDMAYTAQHVARFRVNAYRDKTFVAAALRVIPSKIPTPEELNLPPVIMELANRPRGLMMVTGPSGSG